MIGGYQLTYILYRKEQIFPLHQNLGIEGNHYTLSSPSLNPQVFWFPSLFFWGNKAILRIDLQNKFRMLALNLPALNLFSGTKSPEEGLFAQSGTQFLFSSFHPPIFILHPLFSSSPNFQFPSSSFQLPTSLLIGEGFKSSPDDFVGIGKNS